MIDRRACEKREENGEEEEECKGENVVKRLEEEENKRLNILMEIDQGPHSVLSSF
jgi:hypothetical protein